MPCRGRCGSSPRSSRSWRCSAPECTLAPGLDARPAPGHTPGSTVYVLSSGTQRALLLGDVAHSPVELIEPGWEFAFDVDRAAARAVRDADHRRSSLDSQDLAAAAHFGEPYFGRLVRAEATGREWIFL